MKSLHTYHLVTPSPWPFLASICAGLLALSLLSFLCGLSNGLFFFFNSLISMILIMSLWWRDVLREALFFGNHTRKVQRALKLGFVIFIITEIMFFVSFFWAFFHFSISPSVEIGSIWPPLGIVPLDTFKIPFLNTCLLLYSGLTLTMVHYSLITKNDEFASIGFLFTLISGFLFLCIQLNEYIISSFTIADGVFGSSFYMLTGFHGLHVLIGLVFIFVCFFRFVNGHFTIDRHLGFELAAWYWHFVDVVWLFLFVSVYWWGGSGS
jgi:cytochrome c oxidase subunit 3